MYVVITRHVTQELSLLHKDPNTEIPDDWIAGGILFHPRLGIETLKGFFFFFFFCFFFFFFFIQNMMLRLN